MAFYLEKGIYYWEGSERKGADAIEVPQRPSPNHVWDGSTWQDNSREQYEYDKANKRFNKKSQADIDAAEARLKAIEHKEEITNKLTDWFYDELTHAQIITEVQKIKAT